MYINNKYSYLYSSVFRIYVYIYLTSVNIQYICTSCIRIKENRLPFQTEHGKLLIRLQLALRANGSYPFANGLNGPTGLKVPKGLAHLCVFYI